MKVAAIANHDWFRKSPDFHNQSCIAMAATFTLYIVQLRGLDTDFDKEDNFVPLPVCFSSTPIPFLDQRGTNSLFLE